MAEKRLFIVAYNIRRGGGAVLLLEILDAVKFLENIKVFVLVSTELDIPFPISENIKIKSIKPGLLSRLVAEIYLKLKANSGDTFLFFGNLPPLFKLRGKVFVYMQNRLLVDELIDSLLKIKLPQKIQLYFQKKWLVTRACNADVFLVQSPSIKKLLLSSVNASLSAIQFPFCRLKESLGGISKDIGSSKNIFEFIYVASGEVHKNHSKLFLAWEILAMEGIHPVLHLTLSEKNDSELLLKVNKLKFSGNVQIKNHSDYSHDDILRMYKNLDALIYPSFLESLGLPLIEARELGIPVIASELDYVRDVIDPEFTFNPHSELSIARAVKRFMGLKTEKIVMKTAVDTLNYITGNQLEN